MDRFQRAQNRQKVSYNNCIGVNDFCDANSITADDVSKLENQFKDISTQVAFENYIDKNFIFSCEFIGSDVCTQVTIPKSNFNLTSLVEDKSCGPDSPQVDSCLSCNKFHGFNCIKDEN